MSDILRITGMASGLDVDTIVKKLMTAENTKMDKVKQDKQVIQWKQDLYREILGNINTFNSTYFDYTNPNTNMLSMSNYSAFDVTSVDASSSTAVPGTTASAGVGATSGTYQVTVNKMAKPSIITGSSINNNQATVSLSGGYIIDSDWANNTMALTVGTTTVNLTMNNYTGGNTSLSTLVNDINNAISGNSTLNGNVSVSIVDAASGKIQFNTIGSNTVKISSSTTAVFSGITNDTAINPSTSTLLSDFKPTLGNTTINLNLKYNSTSLNVSIDNTKNNKTIADVISAVSTQTSGKVIASFSQLTGQFTLKTASTGSTMQLDIDTGSTSSDLVTALGGLLASGDPGQDAVVSITPPGGSAVTLTRPSNSFSIDGVNYNTVKEGTTTNITLTSNVQKTFDKIKGIIDKYNSTIAEISDKIHEKKQYSYKPLTDDEKNGMTQDQITQWEDKAKEGLLANDSKLENMLYSMRAAFYSAVSGAGISLKDIGLSTSSDYTKNGKIIIDEDKLKSAIQNNGQQVANLFAKSSSTPYSPDSFSQTRYNEEGIFQRISDVLQDYTRTTRDSSGRKGLLIETAGIPGDLSEFSNELYTQIKLKDQAIADLTQKLSDKEDHYYQQFSKLETAMQQLNSQQSWLTQQLSSMGS